MKPDLEKLALRCQEEEAILCKIGDNGNRICFMNPENISDGSKCKYQGDLVVTAENHVEIECGYKSPYSRMAKRTARFLMTYGGC